MIARLLLAAGLILAAFGSARAEPPQRFANLIQMPTGGAPIGPQIEHAVDFLDTTSTDLSTTTQTLGWTTTSGRAVAVIVGICLDSGCLTNQTAGPSQISGVTLGSGGTLTTCSKIANTLVTGSTAYFPIEAWGCDNTVAGATTVTVTFSPVSSFPDIHVIEYSNVLTSGAFHAGGANWTGGDLTSYTCPSITTTGVNELAFADALSSRVGSGSVAAPYTLLTLGSFPVGGVALVYDHVPSGTTVSGAAITWTAGGSQNVQECNSFAVQAP